MKMIENGAGIETRLRDVLAIHFEPEQGAPYWLDRAKELGFDPREKIKRVADLHRLGTMDPKDLATHQLEEFLPRPLLDRKCELIIAQTGGTLGQPAWTAYQENEFRAAFVEPFVVAAGHLRFPAGGTWLFAGPSGPHIIGRAAEAIARSTGSMTPFSVDFDPRWARKLASGSFAAERYLHHIVDQSLAILESQEITVLFSTPVVIRALARCLRPEQRRRIRGVHYGGMAIESSEMEEFQTEIFPKAVHLSGYGNTLFGCCLELSVAAGRELIYYPHGDRILFG
ncbi:MAG: long-chain fatty acid--CoA ligase, partial [bacterium]|nr:long-chain fatty acid--CoA ligase [bacterium]